MYIAERRLYSERLGLLRRLIAKALSHVFFAIDLLFSGHGGSALVGLSCCCALRGNAGGDDRVSLWLMRFEKRDSTRWRGSWSLVGTGTKAYRGQD